MTRAGTRTGREGESIAERHLRAAGWTTLARRWRTRRGEVDLVVTRGGIVAFVEVKTRTPGSAGHACGDPFDAVTPHKRTRLVAAAEAFLAAHPTWAALPCRFDVIAVSLRPDADPDVVHLEEAFLP